MSIEQRESLDNERSPERLEAFKEKIMKCMVTIQFHPERLTAQQRTEMMALIPEEQAHIKGLREKGIVEAIYISADRAQVWVAMQGESVTAVEQELRSFPLYSYMELLFTPLLDN